MRHMSNFNIINNQPQHDVPRKLGGFYVFEIRMK